MRFAAPDERRSFDTVLARLAESPTTIGERDLLQSTHWNLGEDARLREDVRFRETPWRRWMRAVDLIANEAVYRWLHAERRSTISLNSALQRAAQLFGQRCVFCPDDPRFVVRDDEVSLAASELSGAPVIDEQIDELEKFTTHLPLHSLKAAAASEPARECGPVQEQSIEILGWVRVPLPSQRLNDRMFIAQIEGNSMDDGKSGLVDGSYAVFELWPAGSKQAMNVLVRGSFHDPETGSYAVKKYVEDERDEGGQQHRVALTSLNPDKQRYPNIELDADEGDAVTVVAKVVQALAPDDYERQPKRKRALGRRTVRAIGGLTEQGSRLEHRIATFFEGVPLNPDDDAEVVDPTERGWSPRLVCLDATAGGFHVDVGPLTGLPSFVKKLRMVGTSEWDSLVLAANVRERSTRVSVLPGKGPWRWEAVGFEAETDLGLERLAIDALPTSGTIVFRVDPTGVGHLQQGKAVALGQAYRLLVPPTHGVPGLGTDVGDGWRLWSVDLATPLSTDVRAWLAKVGVEVGEPWPRLEWSLVSPAAWRTNARGHSYPVFEMGDELFVNVRGVTTDDSDPVTLFVHGVAGTEGLVLSGDGLVSLGLLTAGRWACALVHPRTNIKSTTLMFEVVEHATRYVDSACSAIAPDGVASLQISAPPGWPIKLLWRDSSGECLLAAMHASADGTAELDEVRPQIDDRARRARLADLIVDFGELGRSSIEHDGRASLEQVRAALAKLWQQRSGIIEGQAGAWLTLMSHWFEPVTALFGYRLETFAEGALSLAEAHGLAAWRLTVEERRKDTEIARSTSRVLVLTTDMDAALGNARSWIECACVTADVREALVTDGVRWTMHRRGNRIRGRIWNLGTDLDQHAEQMLADLGEGVG